VKILVIGSGGREHAVVKKFRESKQVKEIHCAPGNALIAEEAHCHPAVKASDLPAILKLTQMLKPDLVFVGPEDPLVQGLADQLREIGVKVFGPSAEGAKLEASKNFCKEFLVQAGVPTARYKKVSTVQEVEEALRAGSGWRSPFVLKADGLAGGKGVVICETETELLQNARQFFEQKQFGEASATAVFEEFLSGYECSLLVLTNAREYRILPLAQDHKRLLEGGLGPNTGGMGTIAPLPISVEIMSDIDSRIVQPTVRALEQKQIDYRGVLFFGLMMTPQGPSVLEINCRFGDPETQSILPLLKSDFFEICLSVAEGKLQSLDCHNDTHAACVVVAAPGYPDQPLKGGVIEGRLQTVSNEAYWIGAGVEKNQSGQWIASGGRVLNAMGFGATRNEALTKAYQLIASIHYPGCQYRKDIGKT